MQVAVDSGYDAQHYYCGIWGYYSPKDEKYYGDYLSCPYYKLYKIEAKLGKHTIYPYADGYYDFGTLDMMYCYDGDELEV